MLVFILVDDCRHTPVKSNNVHAHTMFIKLFPSAADEKLVCFFHFAAFFDLGHVTPIFYVILICSSHPGFTGLRWNFQKLSAAGFYFCMIGPNPERHLKKSRIRIPNKSLAAAASGNRNSGLHTEAMRQNLISILPSKQSRKKPAFALCVVCSSLTCSSCIFSV